MQRRCKPSIGHTVRPALDQPNTKRQHDDEQHNNDDSLVTAGDERGGHAQAQALPATAQVLAVAAQSAHVRARGLPRRRAQEVPRLRRPRRRPRHARRLALSDPREHTHAAAPLVHGARRRAGEARGALRQVSAHDARANRRRDRRRRLNAAAARRASLRLPLRTSAPVLDLFAQDLVDLGAADTA